jgi:hypothetical protein
MTSVDLDRLAAAIATYDSRSRVYDQLFDRTSDRVRHRGYATKEDLACIAVWKRLNLNTPWANALVGTLDVVLKDVTREAFAADDVTDRFRALAALPGCKSWGPFASAILCAADPVGVAVRDRRAMQGLQILGLDMSTGSGLARRYNDRVLELRDQLRRQHLPRARARDVDKGLFQLGGPQTDAAADVRRLILWDESSDGRFAMVPADQWDDVDELWADARVPPWDAEWMLDWAPRGLLTRHGEMTGDSPAGHTRHFHPTDVDALMAALQDAGFRVERRHGLANPSQRGDT